jgi:hypothetical protein
MKRSYWKVKAEFEHRGVTLLIDVDLKYGHDGTLATAVGKRIVREEFGRTVELAATCWTAELVHEQEVQPT